MAKVKVSVCIPAYKRVDYLGRLLKSIECQVFRDFEIIVTDDSPDRSVKELVDAYRDKFLIRYYKNPKPLGTPANWNFAISKAEGDWIKLMHDDDWFALPNSLQTFVHFTHQGKKFIFSAYTNVFEDGTKKNVRFPWPFLWNMRLAKEPLTLIANNVIGPPSVIMVHRSITETYDERLKWRVDTDFYIRLLKQERGFVTINEPLVNVGISAQQVTNECFENPVVELPEAFLLLEKYGTKPLKNIVVYDALWRLFRNMKIKNDYQLTNYGNKQWPNVIIVMMQHLRMAPPRVLKIGVFSKMLMSMSFLLNPHR